jgi:hypothetical protein
VSVFKRVLLIAAMVGGFGIAAGSQAEAGIIFRGGPVRRVAARAVLPPYPVARRAVVGPVYRPYYYRPYYRPVYGYGPGISVGVGVY